MAWTFLTNDSIINETAKHHEPIWTVHLYPSTSIETDAIGAEIYKKQNIYMGRPKISMWRYEKINIYVL
jgi:hypothetical protein